jgi:hypothetical protein
LLLKDPSDFLCFIFCQLFEELNSYNCSSDPLRSGLEKSWIGQLKPQNWTCHSTSSDHQPVYHELKALLISRVISKVTLSSPCLCVWFHPVSPLSAVFTK